MPTNYTYLLIDLGSFLIPFVFSFHPKLLFHKQWFAFWPACFITGVLFIIWDIAYTHLGIWGFNNNYIIGITFFNLPLEEILFFICIPYSSLFTYHSLMLFFTASKKIFISRYLPLLLIICLSTIGFILLQKRYTSLTFISTALCILIIAFIQKKQWLPHFFLTYLVILIPFFIVNGILTGSWIEAPIVWYNDSENLGIRLGTIPVEDIFYGMLLLLLNTYFFEMLKHKHELKKNTHISF